VPDAGRYPLEDNRVADASGPRRFLPPDERDLFGRADFSWPKPPQGEEAPFSAAYRQHLIALAVRRARNRLGWRTYVLADAVGMGHETLRRKLRGETWLRPEEASLLALFFFGAKDARLTEADRQIIPDGDVLLPD
jgi:hypothetical protein